jgi:hypothetical protein
MEWFAVRHVLERDNTFKERITLWHAASADEAIRRAEAGAAEYAAILNVNLFPRSRAIGCPTRPSMATRCSR